MRFLQVGMVVFCAVVITTLGISASDSIRNPETSLLGLLIQSENTGACPVGMVEVLTSQTFSCVDIYEVAVGETCPVTNPGSISDSQKNVNTLECKPISRENMLPWTNISRAQAQAMCARAGKRLPTAAEWYSFTVGVPDTEGVCNTTSGVISQSGTFTNCRSGAGVFDAVGNVWEWMSNDVINGSLNTIGLPAEGFVAEIDADGLPTQTADVPSEIYGEDYWWHDKEGSFGLLRGGFYGSERDAGVYSAHSKVVPSAGTTAIGFRCVR